MTTSHPHQVDRSRSAHADQSAWIVEVGGTLRAYQVRDHDVLDGYSADERSARPWPIASSHGQIGYATVATASPTATVSKRKRDPRADTVAN